MTLWIVLTLLTVLAAVALTVPLVRRYDAEQMRETNVGVLRRQLSDIDQQEASGAITSDEAEGMRNEIKRRILAEGRVAEAAPKTLDARALPWVAAAVAGVVALAATGLYAMLGSPDLVHPLAPAQTQAAGDMQHPVADVATMVAQLEAKLRANPDNPEDWRMLGWSYDAIGRPADAATAYGKAAALDPSNASYPSAQGNELVNAAQGQVTPDALAAFKAALKIDPNDARARYYAALYEDQHGDRDKAMADWIALIKSAPPHAPWLGGVREYVERVAQERHIDLSGKLPPANAPAAEQPAGPTQDQVAAAGQMSDADRLAMIHSMVDKLAGELKANPHDADGWVRLMRAHMVLGEPDKAASAYRDAKQAFVNAPTELNGLRQAAQSMGVPGS